VRDNNQTTQPDGSALTLGDRRSKQKINGCPDPAEPVSGWSHPEPLPPSVASPPPSSRASRTGRGGVMHHGHTATPPKTRQTGLGWGGGGVTEIEAGGSLTPRVARVWPRLLRGSAIHR
jgi:hypothetical protein